MDISIPVSFNGRRLSLFRAPSPTSQPYESTGFIGSVARGGSCNCYVNTLIPHTSGTHTECVGHISDSLIPVHDILQDTLFAATLVTLKPQKHQDCDETYPHPLEPADLLLTRDSLQRALNAAQADFLEALIIRTLPNSTDKKTRNYDETGAPFFSTEAMTFIAECNVRHLLVDLPSVDRLNDGGHLSNHRIFWSVPGGSAKIEQHDTSAKTITELIYVPDEIADGQYLLNLQLAPFIADAAPSRPILYKVRLI